MKIFKNPLLTFFLGVILSGGIVYAATISAKDVTYTPKDINWKVDNVNDAIDGLYTRAMNGTYDEYSGNTTYTPNNNTQTIYTNNKLLKSNITINPIPNTYKNLTQNTTAVANNILSGYTAYNNLGELITGNLATDCVRFKHILTQSDSNNGFYASNFKPNYYVIYANSSVNNKFIWYYNSDISTTSFYSARITDNNVGQTTFASQSSFTIDNNGLKIKPGSPWIGSTFYIIVCK